MSSKEVEKPKELLCRLLFRSISGCIENLFGRTILLEFPYVGGTVVRDRYVNAGHAAQISGK